MTHGFSLTLTCVHGALCVFVPLSCGWVGRPSDEPAGNTAPSYLIALGGFLEPLEQGGGPCRTRKMNLSYFLTVCTDSGPHCCSLPHPHTVHGCTCIDIQLPTPSFLLPRGTRHGIAATGKTAGWGVFAQIGAPSRMGSPVEKLASW